MNKLKKAGNLMNNVSKVSNIVESGGDVAGFAEQIQEGGVGLNDAIEGAKDIKGLHDDIKDVKDDVEDFAKKDKKKGQTEIQKPKDVKKDKKDKDDGGCCIIL